MVTKMTIKNQVTIPKKILVEAGLSGLKQDERYFDVKLRDNTIVLSPVTVVIEERIPEKQLHKFEEKTARIEKDDEVFDSAKKASEFLQKRAKAK
ncbi:MAG: hypothetical protein Q8O12_00490 [Candidatus Omnitrophota bacterium]|nr:hypothetical protein [Candidatus Omnitrophota bacterium]